MSHLNKVGIFLVLFLSGCSLLNNPNGRPQDLEIHYQWFQGSLPRPYHYEYSIAIHPSGYCEIIYSPDYPFDGVPKWKEEFFIDSIDLDNLYNLMKNNHLLDVVWTTPEKPPVGSAYETLEVIFDSRKIIFPEYIERSENTFEKNISSAIRSLVPEDLWHKLEGKRDQYRNYYEVQ